MTKAGSIAHVFELTIRSEILASEFYERLAQIFAFYPEVAQFWREKAQEECEHAHWIEKIRDQQSPQRLAEVADPDVAAQAAQAANIPIEAVIAQIHTLQDAYQAANKIEQAETNAIFEFLIETCGDDPEIKLFLREHLHRHVGSLMLEFPRRYGTGTLRRGILAQPNNIKLPN